ncbi:hypothetical protein NEUTE1DRAFT_104923 [Neurospora tetrasperma FGSC 2508]|uniref:Uncharacterized protein n=1 Tax=Neurospora tetrasperma (strain FGSC 2508 / ATCC MYA-4615 / P0657) TaxID=510951 RepID=F8N4R6_NEUT8|nr:uncharacterized protein NEUTE1DRAFT_104923 [Neurospora tetrasperma FGSC 2508]EGO51903.1 hypothetical protein NEUTE1DRAFT_104923 [Neurospora tetrasperma FGSC 2508]
MAAVDHGSSTSRQFASWMPPRTKPKERALAGPVPSPPGRSAVQKSQSVPVTKLPPPPFSPSRFPLHIVLSLAPRLTTDDLKFPGVDDDD